MKVKLIYLTSTGVDQSDFGLQWRHTFYWLQHLLLWVIGFHHFSLSETWLEVRETIFGRFP
jgi:hypothetical protein